MPQYLKKLLIGSRNEDKIREFRLYLEPFDLEIIIASETLVSAPEETGETFEENALIKAKAYANATGLPTLSDDSGHVIPALEGWPGIKSGRVVQELGGYPELYKYLERKLKRLSPKVYCISSIALYWPEEESHIIAFGRSDGTFIFSPRGMAGFGYDSIFVPEGYSKTYAELGLIIKNKISHRALAFQELIRLSSPYLSRKLPG
jgi:XTP/dITP diphosphohydrolase